jgi:hypothetical protein
VSDAEIAAFGAKGDIGWCVTDSLLLTQSGHWDGGSRVVTLAAEKGSEQSQNCSNQRYTQEQENGFQDPNNPWVIVHPIRHPSPHSGPP